MGSFHRDGNTTRRITINHAALLMSNNKHAVGVLGREGRREGWVELWGRNIQFVQKKGWEGIGEGERFCLGKKLVPSCAQWRRTCKEWW